MLAFRGSHILSTNQFGRLELESVFRVARMMEPIARRQRRCHVLNGAVLANLFFEPSTRSRINFGSAFARLGGCVLNTTGFQFSSMAKGETLEDTSRVISGYADIIVMRHPTEGAVATFAAATNIPVINGGDGPGEHPTQALLDLYTVTKELTSGAGSIDGLRIALVGDLRYGRTVHSLAKLLCVFDNVTFILVAPPELAMPREIVQKARGMGHVVQETTDLVGVLSEVDVVYMTRVQQERFSAGEDGAKLAGVFSINRALYDERCRPGTVIMHPLPRDGRVQPCEIAADLDGHPSLAIFRQTDNGIPIRMALFALVLGVEGLVPKASQPVPWFVPDKIGPLDRQNTPSDVENVLPD